MSPDAAGQRRSDTEPQERVWHVGRSWAAAAFVMLALANAGLVAWGLAARDIDSTRAVISIWSQGALAVLFAYQALDELRRRILVDGDGVHRLTLLGRRTYRWGDIDEVRHTTPAVGGQQIELVARDGGVIPLPNSMGNLHVLRRWHAATTGDR